jgi:hypothetical protein
MAKVKEATPKTNLFSGPATPAAATSKSAKKVVTINSDPELEKNLKRLSEIQAQQAELNTEASLLTGEIKPRLEEEMCKLYVNEGKYPGSFNLEAGNSSLMVIPVDKYITIDEERYNVLRDTYGKDVVEETNTYEMNAELIEKYGQEISDLIMGSKKIAEADKYKLIQKKVKYSVKKGTISVLLEKFKKFTNTPAKMLQMIQEIRPIMQMKNVKHEVKEA